MDTVKPRFNEVAGDRQNLLVKWRVCYIENLDIEQIDVSFSCVCPVIDYEFRHNIVQVAVDPQTTLTMLWRNSLPITGQTHEKLTSICFLR